MIPLSCNLNLVERSLSINLYPHSRAGGCPRTKPIFQNQKNIFDSYILSTRPYLLTSLSFFLSSSAFTPEAEFLDIIGTKVVIVFLRVIHSPLYILQTDFTPPRPPEQKWFEIALFFKHCLCTWKPQDWKLSRLCPKTSTKLYVHEFGFWYLIFWSYNLLFLIFILHNNSYVHEFDIWYLNILVL